MTQGALTIDSITKTYGSTRALDAVSTTVPGGSFTVIVGPSGCGKSTLLNIIAGLLPVDSGRIALDGEDVTRKPVGARDLGMVFQDYALYPHMSVARNIGFGLDLQRRHGDRSLTREVIDERVAEAARMVRIDELLGRRPAQLSGGQKQRVALARAVVRHPRILLLDEPLSALDAQLRSTAREELLRLHASLGTTIVMVTHDQHEALSMATHLVVMNNGRIIQAGAPGELYARPVDEFVAQFVGSPAMNVHTVEGRRLGWRPGAAVLGRSAGSADALHLHGAVEVREFAGESWTLTVLLGNQGDRVRVHCPTTAIIPEPGDRVEFAVPAAQIHEFDAQGQRLREEDAA